jgi:hypothetical protein
MGYDVEKKKRKSRFQRFVDKMIESNEKSYGSKCLDCCDIDSPTKKR